MTIEPTPTLSAHDARLLTQRIQLVAGNAREALEKLHVLVEQARSGGAHAALGFASWTDYLSSTLGASPMRLDREQRRELVAYLAGEGMSTRAIAPIVGVDNATLQETFSALGFHKVAVALAAAGEAAREKILKNLSKKIAAVVREEAAALGDPDEDEVADVEKELLDRIKAIKGLAS